MGRDREAHFPGELAHECTGAREENKFVNRFLLQWSVTSADRFVLGGRPKCRGCV